MRRASMAQAAATLPIEVGNYVHWLTVAISYILDKANLKLHNLIS